MIQLYNIYKRYDTSSGPIPALRGIQLEIQTGEFVCLVGKSGAGKSTLVNLVTGIDQPTQGEVFINGVSLQKMSEDERTRFRGLNLGVVFQFFQLLPSISLVQNVIIPMEFCRLFPSRQRRQRAQYLLDQVGIGDHAHKKPANISGGQQQRAAIARALAADPPILVADEPTGNLDSKTASEILDLFVTLARQGKTILLVTHDRWIAQRADRIVEIADGEIH